MKATKTFLTQIQNSLLALGLFILVWSLGSILLPADIPTPWHSMAMLSNPATFEYLGQDLFVSLVRSLTGFATSFAIGSVLGILTFSVRSQNVSNSFFILFHISPGLILGIILLGIFGISSMVPVMLILIMVTPLVAINTSNALLKRDRYIEDYIIAMGGNNKQLLFDSWLPALAGTIKSNSTIGYGLSLKVVILGEFLGCMNGIGYRLNEAYIYMDLQSVFLYLFVVILIMLTYQTVFNMLFSTILNRLGFQD